MSGSLVRLRQSIEQALEQDVDYSIAKTDSEHRYTLGILYVPGARDADNEYADAEELQKAVWDYMRKGYRRIRDTHTQREIGELVELISWPFPVEVDAPVPGEDRVRKYKLPAGTVFAGVVWDEIIWPQVKKGKLRGYSLGGKAVRVKEAAIDDDLPRMAELLADAGITKDTPIPNKPGKTNWVERAGGLPAYIRKIAEDLVDKHGVSGAIRLAVGIVKRWCRGGGNVTAKTRAKACKALAQWEKMKAKSKTKKSMDVQDFIYDEIEKMGQPTDDELNDAEGELTADTLAYALDPPDEEVEKDDDCGCN